MYSTRMVTWRPGEPSHNGKGPAPAAQALSFGGSVLRPTGRPPGVRPGGLTEQDLRACVRVTARVPGSGSHTLRTPRPPHEDVVDVTFDVAIGQVGAAHLVGARGCGNNHNTVARTLRGKVRP